MSSKHAELIDTLLMRMACRGLRWEATTDDEAFLLRLTASAVTIREVPRITSVGPPDYELTLHDAHGRKVDEIRDGDLDYVVPKSLWFERLRALFNQARRSCLDAEGVLDRTLAEVRVE